MKLQKIILFSPMILGISLFFSSALIRPKFANLERGKRASEPQPRIEPTVREKPHKKLSRNTGEFHRKPTSKIMHESPTTKIPLASHAKSIRIIGDEIYVINRDRRYVSIYDLRTKQKTRDIFFDGSPTSMTLAFPYAYIVNSKSNEITVLEVSSHKKKAEIQVGEEPTELILSQDGSLGYVLNKGDSTLSILDFNQQKVVRTIPLERAIVSFKIFRDYALLISTARGAVTVMCLKDGKRVRRIRAGQSPIAAEIAGEFLLVVNQLSNNVSVIDILGGKKIKDLSVGESPEAITVVGTRAYVANKNGSSVSVINLNNLQVVRHAKTCKKPIELVEARGNLFVVSEEELAVSVLSNENLKPDGQLLKAEEAKSNTKLKEKKSNVLGSILDNETRKESSYKNLATVYDSEEDLSEEAEPF